jgi:hypothetical protein
MSACRRRTTSGETANRSKSCGDSRPIGDDLNGSVRLPCYRVCYLNGDAAHPCATSTPSRYLTFFAIRTPTETYSDASSPFIMRLSRVRVPSPLLTSSAADFSTGVRRRVSADAAAATRFGRRSRCRRWRGQKSFHLVSHTASDFRERPNSIGLTVVRFPR